MQLPKINYFTILDVTLTFSRPIGSLTFYTAIAESNTTNIIDQDQVTITIN